MAFFASRGVSQNTAREPRNRSALWMTAPFLVLALVALAPSVYSHLRAASALMVIADMPRTALSDFDANPVIEQVTSFASGDQRRAARLYLPVGIANPAPVVVVHGVHHLGMEEPRLRRFARALASHGFLVMTPQVDELADYNVEEHSAVVIGDAVKDLTARTGSPKVGLLGLSFAGGMGLIAAADPSVQRDLNCVVAIGAHDDLGRVLAFFNTDEAAAPDGRVMKMKAHEYGALVSAYSHASAFFAPEDVAQARVTLRTLLWENVKGAHLEAAKLSPAGQARMAELFAHDTKSLVADAERGLAAAQPELNAASPHYYISRVHVPVYLLHGAGDNVVPPTETLWLQKDLPPGVARGVLISRAIGHVEVGGSNWMDEWRLIHWMAAMMDGLDSGPAR
jgi:pimeloyl-ACP methyl ester carboxylesterase